ncbi:hypothetical protein AGMMS49983_08280 [Clostridia bacterium]|nr:hypothetical protein AGMMS49983_08280 [Clostridia bacterium]
MPLVILGIIVAVGAILMIYYQIGPTIRNRSRNTGSASSSRSGPGSGIRDSFGGYIHLESDSDFAVVSEEEEDAPASEKSYDKNSTGKVLYVFNGGKTEIRPLAEVDKQEDEQNSDQDEDPNHSDDGGVG